MCSASTEGPTAALADESARLRALHDLQVLDTAPEQAFDDLAWLASHICGAPIALVTLVDQERQWFKARHGLDICGTPREFAFCHHAIQQPSVFMVPDATQDPRFADNPLVTGEPGIRFYAGAPLVGHRGHRYGTLCVIDTRPRVLDEVQREGLERLARRASASLESRRLRARAEARESTLTHLLDAMPDGVVTCDAEGRLQEFNRVARDWHGVDPRALPPEQWAEHFDLYDATGEALLPTERIPLLRAWNGERVREAEIVVRAAGQPPRVVLCNADALRAADGTLLGAVCVMHDVTQLKASQAEAAMEAQRFADSFDAAVQGMALVALDGAWLQVNEALCTLFGYSREELLQLDFQRLTHPEDLEADLALLAELLAGQRDSYQMQKRYFHRSGRTLHAHLSVSVVRDADGRPLHFVSQIQDFTQRHQAERRVRESEAKLRGLIESSHDAFVAIDEAGAIVEWNGAAEAAFGWRRSEVLGKPMADVIVPPHLRDAHRRGMARFLATGEASVIGQRLQLPAWHRSQREFPIEMTISTVNVGGRRIFSAFMQDVSERLAAQEALRASEVQLRTIADNAPAMIAHVGPDLRYRFVNRAYAQWFGIDADALVGRSMRDVLRPEHFAAIGPKIASVLQGATVAFDLDVTDSTDAVRHMHASYIPDQPVPGGPVHGVHLMIHDVSPQVRLARLLEEQALRDDLTGLPNRAAWNEELERAVARARRSARALTMMFVDLDGFKAVNDTHGHAAGDRVLARFAQVLRGSVRASDYVARLAGDEFVVLLDSVTDIDHDPVQVARKIVEASREGVDFEGLHLTVSPSIGIGVQRGPVFDAGHLTRCADDAMYAAKRAGRGRVEVHECRLNATGA